METTNIFKPAASAFLPLLTAGLLLCSCKKDDPGTNVNNDLFRTVTLATSGGGSFSYPSSAVPDATGQFIYFTAIDASGAGVFKVPSMGGAATLVYAGAPFSKPMDLVLSTDNQTLFVADSGAGAIYSMSISGGSPMVVMGTTGTAPVALDLIQRSGQDQIFYCGRNAGDGQPEIFEIAAAGSASPIMRYKGTPLSAPSGIVSAKDGTLFVADKNGKAQKLTTSNAMSQVGDGIIMGSPAGISLTPDDHVLAISSKNAGDGTAQVHLIDLQSSAVSILNKTIGSNSNPGGLHVARNAMGSTGIYAWADVTRPGRVYRLEP